MNTRHYLRVFTDAVRALDVNLPGDVAEILEAEPALPALDEARAAAAIAIAEAATLPKREADKKIREALDSVARAEAANAIRVRVRDTVEEARWQAVTAAEPQVRAAFREAVAEDLDVLNEQARIVGEIDPSNASALDPDRFAAFYATRQAAARVETAVKGLAAGSMVAVGPLSPADGSRLRALVLAEGMDRKALRRLVYALRGSIPHGGTSLGSRDVTWYGAAAALGIRFDLVSPGDFRRSADRLTEALRVTEEERARLDSPVIIL